VTTNFTIHNYSTWMRNFNGAPLPPALDVLKLELPVAARAGARGADMIGLGGWGYGGPSNYILAKLMWDAEAEVDTLFDEWVQLAYGPAAGPMRELILLIEDRFRDWKVRESPVYRGMMYEVNHELIDDVYRPAMADIERLYRAALAAAESKRQRQRIEMYGENLVMLHYNMRRAGMELPSPESSIFYRNEADYEQFLKDTEFSIAVYRDYDRRYLGPIWKGEWDGN
ncbi:MAG: hypothetical protein HUU35_06015, partial [Armatimonadetes bacterium]|nr:hypothetical protein [Armatimonadota bacterium]